MLHIEDGKLHFQEPFIDHSCLFLYRCGYTYTNYTPYFRASFYDFGRNPLAILGKRCVCLPTSSRAYPSRVFLKRNYITKCLKQTFEEPLRKLPIQEFLSFCWRRKSHYCMPSALVRDKTLVNFLKPKTIHLWFAKEGEREKKYNLLPFKLFDVGIRHKIDMVSSRNVKLKFLTCPKFLNIVPC